MKKVVSICKGCQQRDRDFRATAVLLRRAEKALRDIHGHHEEGYGRCNCDVCRTVREVIQIP